MNKYMKLQLLGQTIYALVFSLIGVVGSSLIAVTWLGNYGNGFRFGNMPGYEAGFAIGSVVGVHAGIWLGLLIASRAQTTRKQKWVLTFAVLLSFLIQFWIGYQNVQFPYDGVISFLLPFILGMIIVNSQNNRQ